MNDVERFKNLTARVEILWRNTKELADAIENVMMLLKETHERIEKLEERVNAPSAVPENAFGDTNTPCEPWQRGLPRRGPPPWWMTP